VLVVGGGVLLQAVGLYAVLLGSQGFPESVVVEPESVLVVLPLHTLESYAVLLGSQGFPESVFVVLPLHTLESYAVLLGSQGFPESTVGGTLLGGIALGGIAGAGAGVPAQLTERTG
jgi:branched-subunit amino acid transport protein AzlD